MRSTSLAWVFVALILFAAPSRADKAEGRGTPAKGPLTVLKSNPRYFTDGSGDAVYLTGSHTWNNLQDMAEGDPPAAFDFDAYLDFLEARHHNFVRLWRWGETAWDTRGLNWVVQGAMNRVAPHPWPRTGPGMALDKKPKFNLEKLDPAYFERLRARVAAAGRRGIYVSVMLFQCPYSWKDDPFHPANNVNGMNGDVDGDGSGMETQLLKIPAVTAVQERYVSKVIDTLNDLDNVLYEISNESDARSTDWQYHMIRFIKERERKQPNQHPVGMTFQYTGKRGKNQALFDSPADWISPNRNAADGYDYRTNPPLADGKKVIVSDTDHLWGIGGDVDWAWKSFLRGHNPIFMDPFDNRVLGKGKPEQWEPLRQSLGRTRRLAERVNLAAMKPSKDVASTKYCLAAPGIEYLVYQPGKGKFTVDLKKADGDFAAEWLDVQTDKTTAGEAVKGGSVREFSPPGDGSWVLYLKVKSSI